MGTEAGGARNGPVPKWGMKTHDLEVMLPRPKVNNNSLFSDVQIRNFPEEG